jgi:hypothetical protein
MKLDDEIPVGVKLEKSSPVKSVSCTMNQRVYVCVCACVCLCVSVCVSKRHQ